MAAAGSISQVMQHNKYGPLPLQLWKVTVTVPAAVTTVTVTSPNKVSGAVVGVWLDPTTLTASATIKGSVTSDTDGLVTLGPRYFLDYTVPSTAVETRNLLNRRMRVFGTLQVVVAAATAADSFVLYVWIDPNGGTFDVNYPTTKTVTIANSATTSSACDCEGLVPVGLLFGANLTGTSVTFTVSYDESTYTALYNSLGAAVSATVASSRWVSLGDIFQYFTGVRSFKIVSGSTETGGDSIVVIMRPLS